MSERGVFAVDRAIWDHDILADSAPFSRREAWLWLVSEAAWKPHRRRIAGKTFNLERGQIAASLRFIASKWRWSEARVRRFLICLKTEGMVDAKTDAGMTVLTICNYDSYQRVSLPGDAKAESDTDAAATQQRRKVEDKEYKEDIVYIGSDDFPSNAFERFYERYPHKVGKAAAARAFAAVRKQRRVTFEVLLAGVDEYIRTKPPDRAWCNPATWLNQDRWADRPDFSQTSNGRGSNGARYAGNKREARLDEYQRTLARLRDFAAGGDSDGQEISEGREVDRSGGSGPVLEVRPLADSE